LVSNARAPSQISVVLVEDHELAREGMKHILEEDRRINVVGEAAGSEDAIAVIEELQPNVVVLDIRLRQGSGFDVVRASGRVAKETKILVLSAYDDDQYVRSLVRLGVRGYLVKTVSAGEFKRAIHDVAEGSLVFLSGIADKVLGLLQRNEQTSHRASANGGLTGRESEVLKQMGEGLTNGEIARALGISRKTVESHVQRLFLKMGATSRTQVVLSALRTGVVG
jgi:DNA-binding NarL/FixJ family response regulator